LEVPRSEHVLFREGASGVQTLLVARGAQCVRSTGRSRHRWRWWPSAGGLLTTLYRSARTHRSADVAGDWLGFKAAAKPESFYVQDVTGPLLAGELDRAQAWGERLGMAGH